VTDILKLNRRLKKMEEIADELHRASEQIGGNLSKNVIEGMEHQEKLKERYQNLLKEKSLTNRRMLKAFPKMKPTRHEEQFQILKEHFLKSKRKNSKHTEEEKE
jgi:hypothetical protein